MKWVSLAARRSSRAHVISNLHAVTMIKSTRMNEWNWNWVTDQIGFENGMSHFVEARPYGTLWLCLMMVEFDRADDGGKRKKLCKKHWTRAQHKTLKHTWSTLQRYNSVCVCRTKCGYDFVGLCCSMVDVDLFTIQYAHTHRSYCSIPLVPRQRQ